MNLKKLVGIALSLGLSVGAFASTSNYAIPTPDYTDFYTAVGVMLGVALTVMLARKVKSFIR